MFAQEMYYERSMRLRRPISVLFFLSLIILNDLYSQTVISGRVVDASSNKVLTDVNVSVEGTAIGSATDDNGIYFITIPIKSDSVIKVVTDYVGYRQASISVAVVPGDSVIRNFQLSEIILELKPVIVTANRLEENLQDVSIAATVITAEELQNRTINNSLEALAGVPNLIYDEIQPSITSFSIRGISTNNLDNVGFEGGVGMYIDEVYFSRPFGFNSTLIDAARIEVLRGPQGTHFGKNTIGGLIHIVSQKPRMQNYVTVELNSGNFDYFLTRAKINAELISNKLAFYLTGAFKRRNGWLKDRNMANQDANQAKFWGLRGALLWQVNDKIEVLFRGNYGNDNSAENTLEYFGKPEGSPFPGIDINYKDRLVETNTPYFFERRLYGASGYVNIIFNEYVFSSITSYNRDDDEVIIDSDLTRFDAVAFGRIERLETFSQELRLTFAHQKNFSLIAGLYYLHENIYGRDSTAVGPDFFQLDGFSVEGFFESAAAFGRIKSKSYAGYFSASYWFNEQWRVNAGLRYTIEQKDFDYWQTVITFPNPELSVIGVAAVPLPLPGSSDPTLKRRAEDEAPTGNIGIDYRLNKDALLYAKYARGFKGSGFSIVNIADSSGGELVFKPEYLNSYELGVKSMLIKKKVRINAAAFYQDYQNKQETLIIDVRNLVANADKVTGFGGEIEISTIITAELQSDLSIGYLDLKYKDFKFGGEDLSGNRLQKAPEWTVGFSPQYTTLFSPNWQLLLRMDVYYTSKAYSDLTNIESIAREAGTLLNGRLAFSYQNERYSIALWGKNLTDEIFIQHGTLFDWGDQVVVNPPRMFGVEFMAKIY